nr:immunoglobulin heavy chain junction region [Macaca mulatta]MOV51463.1 immunoglobulin heavy chain junction region [Macaca mulatta]MOV51729.1 immunoglobulin heavy chain junction region [Macaca mulatta]MOV52001.1 immunoglobulin heavy chain junction region [Macaca mulatta]MOV52232.1 immunoglobulin heavy chain junction region [Macaca mulatta]
CATVAYSYDSGYYACFDYW